MNPLDNGDWHKKDCPVYPGGPCNGIRGQYPFDFCKMCPVRIREPAEAKAKGPKGHNCFDFKPDNPDCSRCRRKRLTSLPCYRSTKKSSVVSLISRRLKRKRLLIHQNQKPGWKEFMRRKRHGGND